MMELKLMNTKKREKEDISVEYRLYELNPYKIEVSHHTCGDDTWNNIFISKDYNERFLPDIYFEDNMFGERKSEFKIQTTSYGALEPAEIQEVIKGYETAMKVVEILTKEFIK
nr:MAG TPA: hypothetical protein [Caudoviricetes sp.]